MICISSIDNALEMLQPCTKPSTDDDSKFQVAT